MHPTQQTYDAVVIGGGAAGLGGALSLARARRSVLVIDAGHPRNAPASHVHAYLTRDGTPPAELLAAGRAEVTGYGARIHSGEVAAVERRPDGTGFDVHTRAGEHVAARRLLVATGLVDELPDLPGVAELWGRDVLHCPYCHGWEVRDEAIGILATNPLAVHAALLWRQWSADVTLFGNDVLDPTDDEWDQLAARGISVVDGRVAALESAAGRLTGVRLADGPVIPRRALVVAPRFTARSELLSSLGVEPTEQLVSGHVIGSYVAADPSGATGVAGVWVAGNVAAVAQQVIGAADAGVRAGAAINADLVTEDARIAVEERRARVLSR